MSRRITHADLRTAFHATFSAARRAHVEVTGLMFEQATPSVGVTAKIVRRIRIQERDEGGIVSYPSREFVLDTHRTAAREVDAFLDGMRAAFEMVAATHQTKLEV